MKLALALALASLPPSIYPWPIGTGARYHPTAASAVVRAGRPVAGMECGARRVRSAVHVEVFAHRRVAIVPAGVGRGPGCTYPLSTAEPTGVVRVSTARATLGDLFRVWGQRLGPRRLLSFDGWVLVFVDGRRRLGDPRTVRLTPHAHVVLEVGGYVAPHPSYVFPKGTP
jgi:hypothetical protein